MADHRLPLLVLPTPEQADRDKLPPNFPKLHYPTSLRQRERLGPQFQVLRDTQPLILQHAAPTSDPDLVVVLEIIGTVKDFANAVAKVPELVWLNEWETYNVDPDDDFFVEDDHDQKLGGQLYLIGTNHEALTQLLSLWDRWEKDLPFDRGLGRWKDVFRQLRHVGLWDRRQRLTEEVLDYWRDQQDGTEKSIRFEIEAWCYQDQTKDQSAFDQISTLLQGLGGTALNHAIIPEIGYHGILASLPSSSIQQILDGAEDQLVASNRIMFFRPRSQSVGRVLDGEPEAHDVTTVVATEPPVVALLDGLPMENHPLLAGHVTVDDPDQWTQYYRANERVHGTAMASLIIHDELDARAYASHRKLYVRPILRPDGSDTFHAQRPEVIPDDVLMIDLVHRAVRRIFEGEYGHPPSAPTVKIINLSLGDISKPFVRYMSPWARLIDWLSWRYNVLFIVSAGNHTDAIICPTPGANFGTLSTKERADLTLKAITESASERPIISPAESINALTIGALHHDSSEPGPLPDDVFDLVPPGSISPVTRVGLGYRRAIKPDVLFPGGRQVYRRQIAASPQHTVLKIVNSVRAPGHKVAYPSSDPAFHTAYLRGTSNSAAIATRHASALYDVVEGLRAKYGERISADSDAVLLKAMAVHGASWNGPEEDLKQARPDIDEANRVRRYLSRWLGYGAVATKYGLFCTPERATMVGVGEARNGKGVVFKVPLPPSLAGKKVERRLIITLAWLSPVNHANQAYRRARLWFSPPKDTLNVNRQDAQWQSARRGTLQHEVLMGDEATSYSEGASLAVKVSCAKDAGKLEDGVPFALVVSLEVAPGSQIPVYQEIADVIAPKIQAPRVPIAG